MEKEKSTNSTTKEKPERKLPACDKLVFQLFQ